MWKTFDARKIERRGKGEKSTRGRIMTISENPKGGKKIFSQSVWGKI